MPAAQRLSSQVQDAWLAFVRTGAPHHPGIGDGSAYQPSQRLTKVLGDRVDLVGAPDEAERRGSDDVIRAPAATAP